MSLTKDDYTGAETERMRGLLREAQDVILRKVQTERIVRDICDRIDAALAGAADQPAAAPCPQCGNPETVNHGLFGCTRATDPTSEVPK